jgi:hypothetical protein
MKKLLILLAFMPILSYGQFSKGTKFIGGTVSYSSFKIQADEENSKPNTFFNLNSNVGFFVSESFAIGPELEIFTNTQPYLNFNNQFEEVKSSGILGGVFARKFFKISEVFLFSLEGKGLVGNVKQNESIITQEISSTSFHFAFRPVFTFLPSKKWAFDAGIGELSYSINSLNSLSQMDSFMVNLGQITLGVNYFFNRKGEE